MVTLRQSHGFWFVFLLTSNIQVFSPFFLLNSKFVLLPYSFSTFHVLTFKSTFGSKFQMVKSPFKSFLKTSFIINLIFNSVLLNTILILLRSFLNNYSKLLLEWFQNYYTNFNYFKITFKHTLNLCILSLEYWVLWFRNLNLRKLCVKLLMLNFLITKNAVNLHMTTKSVIWKTMWFERWKHPHIGV